MSLPIAGFGTRWFLRFQHKPFCHCCHTGAAACEGGGCWGKASNWRKVSLHLCRLGWVEMDDLPPCVQGRGRSGPTAAPWAGRPRFRPRWAAGRPRDRSLGRFLSAPRWRRPLPASRPASQRDRRAPASRGSALTSHAVSAAGGKRRPQPERRVRGPGGGWEVAALRGPEGPGRYFPPTALPWGPPGPGCLAGRSGERCGARGDRLFTCRLPVFSSRAAWGKNKRGFHVFSCK